MEEITAFTTSFYHQRVQSLLGEPGNVCAGRVQRFLQGLLEAEITELLGRAKSQRREPAAETGEATTPAPTPVYRNGYGKTRKLSTQSGRITLRRPRVRGLEARFESRLLPLFQRRTREVGALLPELSLHGSLYGRL
jgi:transposase-like protein